jgi:hypothetical protein
MAKTPDQVGKLLREPTRAEIWAAISEMPAQVTTGADVEVLQGRPKDWYQPDKVWTAKPVGVALGDGCYARTPVGEPE